MIRVNLLPFRAARKSDNVKRQVIIFIILIIAFVVGCVGYAGLLMNQVAALEEDLARAEADLVRFKKQAAEVDAIMAEIAILEKREATIAGLKKSRFDAVKLMDYLTQLVVSSSGGVLGKQEQRLWLTQLSTKDQTEQQVITIKGVAVDNKDVAAFLDRLEKHTETPIGPSLAVAGEEEKEPKPYFNEVRLLRLAASADATLLNFKEFDIECIRLKATDEETKKKK